MAKLNVTQFAEELKLPVALLLEQLQAAGVKKKAGEDSITEQDKTRLLDYLREMHGNKEEKKKITLTRKQTTEIKKADATGKARTIQVEVRKKRTFVKVDKPEVAPEPEKKPAAPPAPIIDAEEARKPETDSKRQAAPAAPQAAEALRPAEREARGHKRDPTRDARPGPAWAAGAARGGAIKTGGDRSGGREGGRSRGGGRPREGEGGSPSAAPAEPKVMEVLVPETI